jgi:putative mRNA 3-end processing factor
VRRDTRPLPSPVVWRSGVQIAGTILWCDALRARGLCFISSAQVRARAAHRQILTTPRTQALLAAQGIPDPAGHAAGQARAAAEVLVTPYGRPFSLGTLRLELFPSGHLPGAASLLVQQGGRRVIYGGDVCPRPPGERPGLAEPCEVRGGEVLVLGAPVAALGQPLPSRAEAGAQLVDAVQRALDRHQTPVVLAAALGGAQEALVWLGQAGLAVRAHPRIAALAAAYRQEGLALPALSPVGTSRQGPLLWPLELREAPALARQAPAYRIAVTGLALAPDAAARLGVDVAVPLADHGDLESILSYVRATGASEVYLTSGHREILVQTLAAQGVRAYRLGPPQQMDLPWPADL